jgi:KDO2-lipid IV(A) lauroyltransferase
LGIGLIWCLHFLSLRAIHNLGHALGTLAFHSRFSRTTRINLHACFPELTQQQRDQLARQFLGNLYASFLELGLLWWPKRARLEQLITFEDLHHSDQGGKPVISLTPHMVGLEMQGARMGMEFRGVGFFTPHKNRQIDQLFRQARNQLGDIIMLERGGGLRALVRAIKDGRKLYFLPDMDFGDKVSRFAPFFGIQASTAPTLPWLCRSTGAVVVPCACHKNADGNGYTIRFYPAWENFPSNSEAEDLERMNQFIEQQARLYPDQYFWSHKRFRTRPDPSEPNFYRWPQSLD